MNPSALINRMEILKTEYPPVWQELSATLKTADEQEQQDLLLLYAHLDCHDIPSVSPEDMLSYVRASRKARELLPYTAEVPPQLYAGYVLNPRVNNEWPDGSRNWLLEQLYPRVRTLDMMAAALEVNYWCYEQATYKSTDDRTIGPLGICRRGYGRCGEESTLLVCALRAVGIPARQVYAPWWAHCDDNHAWVEFWAAGEWHYMGACEPEYVADQGWFQSAASRAMLIRSRVSNPEREEGYEVVNTTSRYAKTAMLHVRLTHQGLPVAGEEVRFQLINYSSIQTLYTAKTDEQGIARMETGLGSLLVSACLNGIYTERLVTVPEESLVELQVEEGFDPRTDEVERHYTLQVPREIIPAPLPKNPTHQQRLRQCDAVRERKISGFNHEKARGNRAEIEAFLALDGYSMADKELLLQTLSDKDFCDCSCAVLESFLAAARLWKDQYPLSVWQWEILAPRVEHEPLLHIRPMLRTLLNDCNLQNQTQVQDWMEKNLRRVPEFGLTDRRGNAAGYVKNRCCPESEWDILAVQICRTLGIPAVLNTQTKKLCPTGKLQTVSLVLKTAGQSMTEQEHFSLSHWTGNDYEPIALGGCTVAGEQKFDLEQGSYCLTVIRRQIDGTVNAAIFRFPLKENRVCMMTSPADHTAEKLLSEPLPNISLMPLTENAPEVSLRCKENPSMLIFADPGKEPTEHLLREMLDLAGGYAEVPVRILLETADSLQNPTLTAVMNRIPGCAAYLYRETDRYEVQKAAKIGDFRLPLALAIDSKGQIRYGCANYNIRSAATLLHVLSLIE